MRRQEKKRLWAFLVIMTIFVALPILWPHFQWCRHLPRRLLLSIFSEEYVPGPEIEFRLVATGVGQEPKDSGSEFFEFRASDCISVTTYYLKFSSPEDAQQAMTDRISGATRVLSSPSQIFPDKGLDGERAVIFSEGKYSVLRRIGNKFHSIQSTSLSHVLEFEKRDHFELEKS